MAEQKSKYEKNGVLINKLGITNQKDLDKIERELTTFKLLKLFENPGTQTWDIEHYLSIHKYLFGDIYPFAGKIRDEIISKDIYFCFPDYIHSNLKETLNRARKSIPFIDTPEKLFNFILPLYADLDIIHPFREGNGRTLREFIRQYMQHICLVNNFQDVYFLDYSEITREEYLEAVIEADALCQYGKLKQVFGKCLKSKPNTKYKENDIKYK